MTKNARKHTKAQQAFYNKAMEAAKGFYNVLLNFMTGRISSAELDEAIFRMVARHKYSPEYLKMGAYAMKYNGSIMNFMSKAEEEIIEAIEM